MRKEGKHAFGDDAEVYFHRGNKVKTLASPYKDIGAPLGACLGPDFQKKFGVPKTAFPFIVSFSKWPVSAILRTAGFPGGQRAPKGSTFIEKTRYKRFLQ